MEIHPLGKSPVIKDKGQVIIESAAITTYIVDNYAPSGFAPNTEDDDYYQYLELMHYAEGSAMLPFLLLLYSSFLGEAQPLYLKGYFQKSKITSVFSQCDWVKMNFSSGTPSLDWTPCFHLF